MRIISGSALEKQRSSKCRQSIRKPFLSLQLLAAVTLVDSERCIPHQTYRAMKKKKKNIQRVAWKASQARVCCPHTEGVSVVAWEGAVSSAVVLKIQMCSLGSRLGKDHASKLKASSDEYHPFPVCTMQQMTHWRVCVCASHYKFAPIEEKLCKYARACVKCRCERLYMSVKKGLVFQSGTDVSS